MSRKLLLLSGPNLSLLGTRQPEIYGTATLADHVARATKAAARFGFELDHMQSDAESELVHAVHDARTTTEGIVINLGALTHYSWSMHDALAAYPGPVVELHLSNPDARESFRHTSVLSPVVAGSVVGFGAYGYELAIEGIASLIGPGTAIPASS